MKAVVKGQHSSLILTPQQEKRKFVETKICENNKKNKYSPYFFFDTMKCDLKLYTMFSFNVETSVSEDLLIQSKSEHEQ